MDYILNAAYFAFFGAMMPWGVFNVESMHVWRYIVLSIAVLLLKRLPPLMALYRFIPMVKTWKEAALMGYFGPVGLCKKPNPIIIPMMTVPYN